MAYQTTQEGDLSLLVAEVALLVAPGSSALSLNRRQYLERQTGGCIAAIAVATPPSVAKAANHKCRQKDMLYSIPRGNGQ